jgi:hypothetical protein
MVRADRAEQALSAFLRQLVLPRGWKAQVLDMIRDKTKDIIEVEREQNRLQGQLLRLKKLFVLGDVTEFEYQSERDHLRAKLVTLKPLNLAGLEEAGQVLENFGLIWDSATEEERQRILRILLSAVYLDSSERGPVVAIEPKPGFGPLFEVVQKSADSNAGRITILPPGAKALGVVHGWQHLRLSRPARMADAQPSR